MKMCKNRYFVINGSLHNNFFRFIQAFIDQLIYCTNQTIKWKLLCTQRNEYSNKLFHDI